MRSFYTFARKIERVFAAVLCFVMIAALIMPAAVYAQESGKTVRVGWYDSPFNSIDQFGRRSGYAYEYQQKLVSYTGWTYEYVEGSWPELYQMLLDGEIDLMSDVSFTPERAESMLFSALPMGAEVYYIFITQQLSSEISADDLSTMNGRRIGVNKGSVQSRLLYDWVKRNALDTEIIELTVGENESLDMLKRGEMDAFVSIDAYGDTDEVIPVCRIGTSDFFFAVNKSRPDLLSELDAAMNKIQEENRNYSQQLFNKYIANTGANLFLTRQEMDWLSSHGPIRVGYRDDYLAFCGTDEKTGKLTGALAEFLEMASRCTQNAEIEFETTAFQKVSDALTALEKGEVDCVFPINISAFDAEKHGLLVTSPQMQTEMYAVVRTSARRGFSLQDNVTVAVNEGNPNYETFLMDNFPGWTRTYYEDLGACIQAVSAGKADCVLVSNYRINRITGILDKYDLSPVTTGVPMDSSFAVGRHDLILYSILEKVTNLIPPSSMNSALTYWSYVDKTVTFADYLKRHILAVSAAVWAVLTVILLLLVRSRRSEKKAKESEKETRKALEQIETLNAELSDSKKSLQEALAASQQASRAKTAFLSNMSHEIRTPLNAIVGFTSLAEQHIDERQRVLDYVHKISTSGSHLLSLINDVLDVSRIESGRLVLRDEEFSFRDFLTQINTMIGGQCVDKGLTYSPSIIGAVGCVYSGDEMKLKEVLINILGNAVKYTPAGGTIRFTVEQISGYSDLCTLRFVAADTGIGMSEEFLPKLFDAFSQEDEGSLNQYGSTGLGMAITRSIVQLMNGEINVESKKGVGSTFTITVTLKDAHQGVFTENTLSAESGGEEEKAFSDEEQGGSLAGLRVLIVEDMEMNAELLGDILDLEDVEHEWAENGQIAVERFSESPAGSFDAILMDVRMPVMDGLQASRAIRALSRPDAQTIPIIAMSANAFSEDVQMSLQAGMNVHLSKPVDTDQLFKELGKIAARKERRSR